MATPEQIQQALYDYIAGNAAAPSWLGQLANDPSTSQLYNFVTSARTSLSSGISDPQAALGQLSGYLGNLVGTVFPNTGQYNYDVGSGTPAPDRPLPTNLPWDPNRPNQYVDPRNAIPDFQGPDSGAVGVTPATPTLTDAQKSAQAQLNSTLAQYGLGNLGSNLWQQYLSGTPIDQIYLNMRQTPEYQARFPAMKTLDQQGRSMTESQYISLENSYRDVLHANGIPSDVIPDTPGTYASWITGSVSPTEVKDRATLAAQAAVSAPAETRSELQRLYGITGGDLTAYWLDPQKALPALQQRYAAASLAGTADRTGYSALSQGQAEGLAGLGISDAQATQGFSQLAGETELFNPLDQGENSISQQDQLNAQFGGDAIAQRAIQQRIARRKAQFAAGGGYADNGRGLTGVGTNVTG